MKMSTFNYLMAFINFLIMLLLIETEMAAFNGIICVICFSVATALKREGM